MNRRYALATDKDTDAGLIWSTGGVWSANVPEAEKLLTGPEVDAFAARHLGTTIVDVVVYRAMCAVHLAGFRSVIPADFDGRSTPELRDAARNAGRQALISAGYRPTLNPCAA